MMDGSHGEPARNPAQNRNPPENVLPARLAGGLAPASKEISMCQSVIKTPGIADVAPNRLHISRHYGNPFHQAARMGDGRLVSAVSWLAAQAFPPAFPIVVTDDQ